MLYCNLLGADSRQQATVRSKNCMFPGERGMRLISINGLNSGETLYSNITNCKGIVMLKNGTPLTDSYINRLKNVGIYAVYVDDEFSDDMEIRPAISDKTKLRLLDIVADYQKTIQKGGRANFSATKKLGQEIYDEVKSSAAKPINLINTYAVDYPVLLHSINVAVIVAAMVSKTEIRRELAESYIVAALLHDITLSSMDEDYDVSHAQKAYELLKNSSIIGPTTYVPVLMHHECYNGTGEPKGYKGDSINEGARIIAAADMYDNLIFGYGGNRRLTPYTAVEYISAESGKTLDPEWAGLFAQCVAVYPTGATVLLNNGYQAIVVSQNEGLPTRPVVRLLKEIGNGIEILNLLWEHTVFINELYL